MIGNAHLDPVWLWPWQEGFQEAKATFRSVLDLMKEFDDFFFTSSSAALYEWIEHNDLDMLEEIRVRVGEGRWEICGGWWIQPDCNIPSGEALVRQGLYGQRYFREKLGVTATVGYNPDSFGHAGSLPQILRKSGLSHYVFMRPHPHENSLPSRLFWWESNDGSRVLAFRIPYEYCTSGRELQEHVRRCMGELRGDVDRLMCFYGVGNHGGGPTRRNLASIREMDADPAYPRLVFSTTARYFADAVQNAEQIPVLRDELQHHASGCYAAHSGVKRWNRQAESSLVSAEIMSALARRVAGLGYPDNFAPAWKSVLFNQFHDILAGTSIEPAYEDARDQYGEAMAIAARNLNGAVQAVSWRIGIEQQEGTHPVVVFNPHSWPVETVVEYEFGRLSDGHTMVDADGNAIPLQRIRPLASVSPGSRTRLCFPVQVPPLGYHTYRLVAEPLNSAPVTSPAEKVLDAGDTYLENPRFRLEINPETGCLARLYDKQEEFEWLRAEAAKPVVIDDSSDTWSHGVLVFDDVAGEFSGRSVELIERGPVRATLRVESEFGRSRLRQDFTMYPDRDQIDVAVEVDWHEQFKMLKLHFPVNLFWTTATYETPYGYVERPTNGEEEPGQRWVDLSGVGRGSGKLLGFSILNDAKYSFDMKEHEINLTVLRSPIYAFHVPHVPEPGGRYTFIDQGLQRFRYSLLPHTGRWGARTYQRAAELNQPLIAQIESCHPGPLPQQGSYVSVEPENVVIAVLKQAEDGEDLIVRCFETTGAETEATIGFPHWNRQIEARFGPSELKTFRIPAGEAAPVVEVDLVEEFVS